MEHTPAHVQLRDWIRRSRITQRAFCQEMGVSEPHFSRLLAGRGRPSLDLVIRINARTGIPVAAWAPTAGAVA